MSDSTNYFIDARRCGSHTANRRRDGATHVPTADNQEGDSHAQDPPACHARRPAVRRHCRLGPAAARRGTRLGQGPPEDRSRQRMAPVPAFPIPTAADKLPTAKFKLPPGFKVETWASGVLDARELRQGAKRHGVRQHAVRRQQGLRDRPRRARRARSRPSSTRWRWPPASSTTRAALYLATHKQILRYDNIDSKLDNPGHADGALRQAARRRGPQLEVPAHPQGQALLPDRRALQHLRSRRVRQDLPHEPRRQRHRDHRQRRAQHGGLRLRSRRPAASGSPTTAATGSARRSRTTSSTSSPARTSTSAIRTATRATSPTPEFGWGKSLQRLREACRVARARTPARWA